MTDVTDALERAAALGGVPEDAIRVLGECVDRCVFFTDADGHFVFVNRAFCGWLGRTEDELVGHSVSEVCAPEVAAQLIADDRRALAGERVEREAQFLQPPHARTVRLVKEQVRDARGRAAGILNVFSDVTDERRHSEEVRHGLGLIALGRLTGALTHDLNHLLTLIRGNATLLTATTQPPNAAALRLETAADRAVDLTRRLVAFARVDGSPSGRSPSDSAPLHTTDLNAVVAELASLLAPLLPKNITFDVRYAANLPTVPAPSEQLARVVLNLCLNARDAMPDGGRLLLETDLIHVGPGELAPTAGRPWGPYVRFRVTDTGHGLAVAEPSRLLQPLPALKPKPQSTGLGLSIVKDIVQQFGGWVECSSVPGVETSFAIQLPPIPAPSDPQAENAERPILLLVDNDPSILALCRVILESARYDVLTATDGDAALALVQHSPRPVALVLLDQFMPGKSGLTTARELLVLDPRLRLVLVSGAPPDENLERAGLIRGYLSKPFKANQLLTAVRDALAK